MGRRLLTVLALCAASAPARAACPDFLTELTTAESAVLEARVPDAQAAADRAEQGLACGPVVAPWTLARLWVVEGVVASLSGDQDEASLAFASAARVAPGQFADAYGPRLRATYDAAVASARHDTGEIRVDPPLVHWVGAVDGVAGTFPREVEEGLHVVQVGPSEDEIRFAKVVFVAPGQSVVVATDVSEGGAPAVATSKAPKAALPTSTTSTTSTASSGTASSGTKHRPPVLLIAGGASLAGAIATGALAVGQNDALRSATTLDELDGAHQRQVGYAVASYALAGLGVTGVGLGLVF